MNVFNKEKFEFIDLNDPKITVQDMTFNTCQFEYCNISDHQLAEERALIKNVSINKCVVKGSSIGNNIFEDITVDGLKTNGLLQTWAAVFKHVILKGKIGRIMITTDWPNEDDKTLYSSFLEANDAFYKKIDWALDISNAEFEEFEVKGIPGHLIKIDHETQGILLKERLLNIDIDKLGLKRKIFKYAIEDLLDSRYDDWLIVAPKKSRNFDDLYHDLNILKNANLIKD
jgi:hypothetical protein